MCLSLTRIFAKVAALKFEFDGTQDLVSMTQRPILGQNPERAILQRCYFIAKCQHGKQILPHMKFYLLRLGDIWEYSESILHQCFQKIGQQSTYNTERNLLFPERAFYRRAQGKLHVTQQSIQQFCQELTVRSDLNKCGVCTQWQWHTAQIRMSLIPGITLTANTNKR